MPESKGLTSIQTALLIFGLSVSFSIGMHIGKFVATEGIESSCEDFGKTRINDLIYECKLK